MGLFGFGKKKDKTDKTTKAEDEDVKAAKAANEAARADSELAQKTAAAALPEAASDYEGRGEERGPWDVNDENVPDYDEYLDLGAYYLPFLLVSGVVTGILIGIVAKTALGYMNR